MNKKSYRKGRLTEMIAFVNTFLSYLLLLFIIVAVAGIGVVIGINMRKKKDAKALAEQNTEK